MAEPSDSASMDSTGSSIVAKASKLRTKFKNKLRHHHDDDDGVDEEEDEDEQDDGPVNGLPVHSGQESYEQTPAQLYAGENSVSPVNIPAPIPANSNTTLVTETGGRVVPLSYVVQHESAPPTHTAQIVDNNPGTTEGHGDSSSIRSTHPPTESDWKRKAEFHNLFEDIDTEEELVSDFSSAWAKDILRHGRLYVGAQHLAFICSIIGLKTQCIIPFAHIMTLEKSMTAKVIPNALTVTTTDGESYLFTSFVGRDHAFDIIEKCWEAENPEAYQAMVSTHVADLGLAIDESTEDSPFPKENGAPATEQKVHPATEPTLTHFSEVALDVRFPSEPEKIFNLLYRNLEFQKSTCESQKLTDIKLGDWTPGDKPGFEKREFSYVKPLSGSVGPSSTTCHIMDEELLKDPEKSYEVFTVTKTPDVPSGKSFEVQTKTSITWAGGAKGGCRMLASTEVVWSSRSMLKGIITSASIAGQRDYNKELAKSIRAHIAANAAEFGSSDITAPEADDELGAGADMVLRDGDEESTAGIRLDPGHSFLGPVWSKVQAGNTASSILALSNVILLVIFLTTWLFGTSNNVKVQKVVMSSAQEAAALQRLQTLEAAWAKFKQCVDVLANETM